MGGSTINPIRSMDVVRYCREVLRLDDEDLIEEVCSVVAEMDDEFLADVVKRRKGASDG